MLSTPKTKKVTSFLRNNSKLNQTFRDLPKNSENVVRIRVPNLEHFGKNFDRRYLDDEEIFFLSVKKSEKVIF